MGTCLVAGLCARGSWRRLRCGHCSRPAGGSGGLVAFSLLTVSVSLGLALSTRLLGPGRGKSLLAWHPRCSGFECLALPSSTASIFLAKYPHSVFKIDSPV
jgi:hypothetical protein